MRTYGWLIIFLLVSGCAKHGMYMEIGKGGSSVQEAGYGGFGVTGTHMGPIYLCIPSEEALSKNESAKWCADMKKAHGESMADGGSP